MMEDADRRTEVARPFWLTEPCPDWCRDSSMASGHSTENAVGDRMHFSERRGVLLSLVDGTLHDGEVVPEFMNVHLAQHYRETEPRVWLGQSDSRVGWFMTPSEALGVANELVKAAQLATPGIHLGPAPDNDEDD